MRVVGLQMMPRASLKIDVLLLLRRDLMMNLYRLLRVH